MACAGIYEQATKAIRRANQWELRNSRFGTKLRRDGGKLLNQLIMNRRSYTQVYVSDLGAVSSQWPSSYTIQLTAGTSLMYLKQVPSPKLTYQELPARSQY